MINFVFMLKYDIKIYYLNIISKFVIILLYHSMIKYHDIIILYHSIIEELALIFQGVVGKEENDRIFNDMVSGGSKIVLDRT